MTKVTDKEIVTFEFILNAVAHTKECHKDKCKTCNKIFKIYDSVYSK